MMMLGAGTSLMKLLNSFFTSHVDEESGRKLFADNIKNVRMMSVRKDDLPARLAEAMTQLWRYYREGDNRNSNPDRADDRLKLRIQARGSMSVLYDSVWQWREQFSFPYDGKTSRLDSASNNPTLLDLPPETAYSDPNVDFNAFTNADMMSPTATLGGYPTDPNFDLFDPVSIMLDNPMNYAPYPGTSNNMTFMDNTAFYG